VHLLWSFVTAAVLLLLLLRLLLCKPVDAASHCSG
jgi:hypothetical protein